MCPSNIGHVMDNVIIFTSLGCVISHHNGPYHPKSRHLTGVAVSGIARVRTVGVRKQGFWRSGGGIGAAVPVRHDGCKVRQYWLGPNQGSGQQKW